MRNGTGGNLKPGKPGRNDDGGDDGNGNGKRGMFPGNGEGTNGNGGKSDGNGGTPPKGKPGGNGRLFAWSVGAVTTPLARF